MSTSPIDPRTPSREAPPRVEDAPVVTGPVEGVWPGVDRSRWEQHPLYRFSAHSWKILLGVGLAALAVGVLVLAWPSSTAVVIGVLFGVYLLVSGVAQFFLGLMPVQSGLSRGLLILTGVLSVVLGVMCFKDHTQSIYLLALWIGIGWLFSGVSHLVTGVEWRGPGSGWMIASGLLGVLAALIVMFAPVESLVLLVWLAGLLLVAAGIGETLNALALRRSLRRLFPTR